MPEISVIVPIYNTEKYLHRCIDSILAQSFSDFELILVDDGSTDASGAICDEYARNDSRIYVIHQKNRGQSAARNAGIEWALANSNSKWISFIDSDDWVHSRYFELLLAAAESCNTLISSCSMKKVQTDLPEESVPENVIPSVVSPADDYMRNSKGIFAYVFMRLFNKSLWETIRFPEGMLWEDVATIYKVLFSCSKTALIDVVLYYYFSNPNGTVRSPWIPKRMEEFTAYEEQMIFFASQPEWRKVFNSLQGAYIRSIGYSFFLEQNSDLPPDEKKKYEVILRKKLREAFLRYRRTSGISFKTDRFVYDAAFPKLMRLYWIIHSRIDRNKKR